MLLKLLFFVRKYTSRHKCSIPFHDKPPLKYKFLAINAKVNYL